MQRVHLREQLVDPAEISLLGSIQEGTVPSQKVHYILVPFLEHEHEECEREEREEEHEYIIQVFYLNEIQRCMTVTVLLGGISPMLQQKFHNLVFTLVNKIFTSLTWNYRMSQKNILLHNTKLKLYLSFFSYFVNCRCISLLNIPKNVYTRTIFQMEYSVWQQRFCQKHRKSCE